MKKIISLIIVFSFLCANQVWAARLFYAPMTSNANATIHDASSVAATVSGPDGWYTSVDTDGVLQGTDAQASPSARIEADGLLCEGQGKNVINNSICSSGLLWLNEQTYVTSYTENDPTGGTSAWRQKADSGGAAFQYIYPNQSFTGDGNSWTLSIYAKSTSDSSLANMILRNTTDSAYSIDIDFQVSGGVWSVAAENTGTGSVQALGSTGWYRLIGTGTATNTKAHAVWLCAHHPGSAPASNITTDFYGVQLEESPYPTSYIPTSGAPAVRWSQEGAVDTTVLLPLYNTSSFNIDFSDGSADCQTDEYDLDLLVLPAGSDKYRIVIEDDENDQAVGFIYADDAGQAGGVLVVSTKDGSTRNWNKDVGFNEADDEYNVYVEFVDVNGIYWPHASLWATDWATDMDPEGTMSVEWTPNYAEANAGTLATGYGIIALSDATQGFLYHEDDSKIYSADGTNTNDAALAWANGTTYDLVNTWVASTDQDLYIDGTGTDGDMDAGWTTGTNLIIGFDNPYPFHLKDLSMYDGYGGTCTIDVHISDKAGNNLQGATVACEDVDGNACFTAQTTGADGTITQQSIVYYKEVPMTFTFSYPTSGYETIVWENIDWDTFMGPTIDWHLELQPAQGAFPSPWR